MSIESVMASSHLVLCCLLLLLPLDFPNIRIFFLVSLFTSGSKSIKASASASVFPICIQDLFPLGLTSLIFLQSKGLSRVFSNTTVQKHQFFIAQLYLWSNSYICTWLLKNRNFVLVGKAMPLLFNMLSRLVIAFIPRSNCHNFMGQSPSAVILEPKKTKSVTVSTVSPPLCH